MIGRTISHYKILEKLGEGGMGVVYKAQDITLDRPVALKFLPQRSVVNDDDRARFANEARAAARLTHPNIATVYEFGEANSDAFLAIEFIDGETLRKKLQQGPLSVSEALRVAGEVAKGLAAAHQHEIIHRDIKSENIMLTPQGAVKITDFGLAQIRGQSRLWHTEGTAGTVSYMSPEQARGEALDERTDIWSLGVVLYEMLTAKLPFPGNYESAILYLVIHEQPQPIRSIREDVPTKLQEVVEKCLKKDPGQRYRNAEALLSDVNALVKELEQGVQEPQEKPIEQRRYETERRPVTILFATILAAGQESEEPDPEALSTGLDECFDGLASIIQKYEGMKDRILGDRLMAVFGAPAAHENDPERAVRCAQEMMSYMKRINALGVSQASTKLQLKIGIHSGVVVAGNVGTEKGAGYSVVGDVINITAGITDLVQPGEVHLSADTLKLVSEIVEVGEARSIPLKGKIQEIIVYELRSLKAGIEPGRRAIGGGAFVGRAEEIRLFEESLERVQKKGEVRVFIRGEAGVGKTRLKSELTNRAQKLRMSICEGKCSSFETNTPYYLWNTLLRSLLRVDQETPESEVRSRLHEMAKILTLESDEPYLATLLSLRYEEILLEEDEQRKKKIFDAARRLLKTYAERKPSVFLFEDLHWIDRFSQSLLEFVLSEEQLGPALIVCFYRPEYAGAKGITESRKELDLNRLPAGEARELMRLRLGAESMPENLASLIEQRSEGNPFFIEEIIKTLMDKGIVSVKKGKLEIQSEKLESGVPETLQGVILARIDRLEERIREVLLDASVIGREFSTPVLEQIVQKKIDVKGGLKKLESLELVFEKEDARELEYLFKHYLIQEVAYNTLLQKKRKQIHLLIAQAIEKLYLERLNEFYEMLAFHYEKAEQWEKAADYLSRAGNKMREFYTKEESRGFSERTNAARAKLAEGKGVKNRILFLYRAIFGYMFLSWFLLPPLLVYRVLTSPGHHSLLQVVLLCSVALFYAVLSIWGGLRFFQILRARPKAFELFENRVEIIFNDGTSQTLDFSEIQIVHFFKRSRFRGIVEIGETLMLRSKLGSLRKQERINPASFGFGSKNGEIHIRRKTGLSFYSKKSIYLPWQYKLVSQRDLSLTPSNPEEFYEQLLVALEKWRLGQSVPGEAPKTPSYRRAPQSPSDKSRRPLLDKEPLLKIQPVFKIPAVLSTMNFGWYLFAFFFPLFFVLAIVGGGYKEFDRNYFLIIWDGFLFSMLVLFLSYPVWRRKKMINKLLCEFLGDSMRLSIPGSDGGIRIISCADIISAELINKTVNRILNCGNIVIRTNAVACVSEATGLAETALIIPDVPDAGRVVERINEIVRAFKEREGN